MFEPKREGQVRSVGSLPDFAGPLTIATILASGLGALADATGPSDRAVQAAVAGLVALVVIVTGHVSGRLPSKPSWIIGTGAAVGLLALAVDRVGGGEVRAAATPILAWAAVTLAVLAIPRTSEERHEVPAFVVAHVDAGAFAAAGAVVGLFSFMPGIASAGLDSFVRAAPLAAACFLLASNIDGVRSRAGLVAVGVVTGVLAVAVELSTDVGGGRGVWLDASAGVLFVLTASARTGGGWPIGLAAGAAALASVAGASVFTLVLVAVVLGVVMLMSLPGVLGGQDRETEPVAEPRIIHVPTVPIATGSATSVPATSVLTRPTPTIVEPEHAVDRDDGHGETTAPSSGAERSSTFTFDLWREMGVEAPTEVSLDDDVVSEFTRTREFPNDGASR